MNRVQVYNPKLLQFIEKDAIKRGLTPSAIVEEILIAHYMKNQTEPSGVQIRETILKEVIAYVWRQEKPVFDLADASESFRALPVEKRASIGRSFASSIKAAQQTHTPPLCDVHVLKEKGVVKKSANNSTLYIIEGFNEYAPFRSEKEVLQAMFSNAESVEEIDNFVEGVPKRAE